MSQPSPPAACILVVDEDVTLLGSLQEMLRIRLQGVEAVTCHSAAGALRKLGERDYDVVVTNIKLQGMDGLELLAQIQQRRPHTPAILMSGYEDYSLAIRALRSRAYDIIQKPIDWDYFIKCVSSALQTEQLQRLQLQEHRQHSLLQNPNLLRGLKVLVVDDDPDGREMQAIALQEYGARVRSVASVAAALDIIDDFKPDVLLSDIRMPLEDGYSLMRKLRRKGRELPAVAVTAYAQEEAIERALKSGYQLQLAKPVDPELLALTVATISGRLMV
jgi:DNA-binding NtrC family response regulator